MEFVRSTAFYLKLFYWLGLSPFYPSIHNDKPQPQPSTFSHKIPTFVNSSVSFALCVICVYNVLVEVEKGSMGRTIVYMRAILISTQIMRSIVMLVQCLCYRQTYIDLITTYDRIEIYFSKHLKHTIDFKVFTQGVATKTLLTITMFLQYVIVHAWVTRIYGNYDTAEYIIKFLQFLSMFTTIHLVFSIDTLVFFLQQLRTAISRDAIMDRTVDSMAFYRHSTACVLLRNQLKIYKCVQFMLWENSLRLNRFFGWILIFGLSGTFLDIAYASYTIMDELRHFDHISWEFISERPDDNSIIFEYSFTLIYLQDHYHCSAICPSRHWYYSIHAIAWPKW